MKHRYPKVSEDFKYLAHNHMLILFPVRDKKGQYLLDYKLKSKFRYRLFFKERALAFK